MLPKLDFRIPASLDLTEVCHNQTECDGYRENDRAKIKPLNLSADDNRDRQRHDTAQPSSLKPIKDQGEKAGNVCLESYCWCRVAICSSS
ncbi:MAG: hypothetical protein AAF773_23725 [Cyanobacteria bacterium P01_D01_bin.115]